MYATENLSCTIYTGMTSNCSGRLGILCVTEGVKCSKLLFAGYFCGEFCLLIRNDYRVVSKKFVNTWGGKSNLYRILSLLRQLVLHLFQASRWSLNYHLLHYHRYRVNLTDVEFELIWFQKVIMDGYVKGSKKQ